MTARRLVLHVYEASEWRAAFPKAAGFAAKRFPSRVGAATRKIAAALVNP
jgi:hypothetical protein